MPKAIQYRNAPMPQYEAEMFLLDMEDVDAALRLLIRDHCAGEIRLTQEVVSRIRGMIQTFDRYHAQ